MKLQSLMQELVVNDILHSKKFYTEVIGLSLNFEDIENKTAVFSMGEQQISLVEYDKNFYNLQSENKANKTDENNNLYNNYKSNRLKEVLFEFRVDNIEKFFTKIAALGVNFYKDGIVNYFKDKNSEYITKEFIILDPDENLIKFTETLCLFN